MNVYHTPVIVAAKTIQAFTEIAPDVNPVAESNMIESAIRNALKGTNEAIGSVVEAAIHNAIFVPAKALLLKVWERFMAVSHFSCLVVASVGVVLMIVGIEKGKKIAIIATLTFLGLQILNWVILG